MDNQQTIFSEEFNEVRIRRRAIMPGVLKGYIWIGMFLGLLSFLSIALSIFAFSVSHDMASTAGMLLPGTIVFLMTYLLWSEVKWAIRFNWCVAGVLLIMIISTAIYFGTAGISLMLPIVGISLPYWIMLFRIQQRWEQKAVAAKEI